MPGGLIQLVAYGAQDAYLSGNPQITFWKGLFKRHTNFAMEAFRVNMTGQAAWGTKHSAILGRHADLIYNTYLEVELPAFGDANAQTPYGWAGDSLGFKLLNYVELDIGGQIIDRLYGEWLYLWSQLTLTTDARAKLQGLIQPPVDTLLGADYAVTTDPSVCGLFGKPARPTVLYIPIYFFYTRNPGAALPLIALQYHEVKINVLWNKAINLTTYQNQVPGSPKQANLIVDYIYLDVEERRRMAQQSHEYLIEQTQYNEDKGFTSYANRVDLTFNHPVKELIWVTQQSGKRDCTKPYYTAIEAGPPPGPGPNLISPPHAVANSLYNYDDVMYDCTLQINGQDRLGVQYGQYFGQVQPFQHHTGTTQSGLYVYSFALRPEEHQPSGTCNFSRIDTATLVFNVDGSADIDESQDLTFDVRCYAINYNILRVMSGMGGLAYSN